MSSFPSSTLSGRPGQILGSLEDARSALEDLRYRLTIAKLSIAAGLRDGVHDALRAVDTAVTALRPRARGLTEALGDAVDPDDRRARLQAAFESAPALAAEAERELAEVERLEDEVRELAQLIARLGRQAATEVAATLQALGGTRSRADAYTAEGVAALADHRPARLDEAV